MQGGGPITLPDEIIDKAIADFETGLEKLSLEMQYELYEAVDAIDDERPLRELIDRDPQKYMENLENLYGDASEVQTAEQKAAAVQEAADVLYDQMKLMDRGYEPTYPEGVNAHRNEFMKHGGPFVASILWGTRLRTGSFSGLCRCRSCSTRNTRRPSSSGTPS